MKFTKQKAKPNAYHSSSLWLTKNSLSCWRRNSSLYSAYFLMASSSVIESSWVPRKDLNDIMTGWTPSTSSLPPVAPLGGPPPPGGPEIATFQERQEWLATLKQQGFRTSARRVSPVASKMAASRVSSVMARMGSFVKPVIITSLVSSTTVTVFPKAHSHNC